MDFNESLLSSDQSTIYSLTIYHTSSNTQALFVALNTTYGSINGNSYYSGTISWYEVYSLIQGNSMLYSVLKWITDYYIFTINLSPIQFSAFKMTSGVSSYGIAYDPLTDR